MQCPNHCPPWGYLKVYSHGIKVWHSAYCPYDKWAEGAQANPELYNEGWGPEKQLTQQDKDGGK